MTIQDLTKFKDQHGRIVYRDKFGEPGEWFGYIREVNGNHVTFEDNETPHKFKIHEVIDFKPIKLPEWEQ
jgi:hypothetical protein